MLAGGISPSGAAFKSGSMIDIYRVLGELGKGGMGVVYDVLKTTTNKPFALKMLHPAYASGELVRRFSREAMLGGTLTHKNIVEIIDSGVFNKTPYLVMEKLQGSDLSAHVRDRIMTFEEAYPILTQVMDALEFAHGKRIVHRDLKPANIFVCDGDPLRIKLLDFGISKLLEGSDATDTLMTQVGMRIGTPHYMSPEQALGFNVDHRTDIWALGAITYRMLTGKKPYDGKTPEETMFMISAGEQPPPLKTVVGGTPPGMQAIIDRALKKALGERFQSIHEFRTGLRNVHGTAQAAPQSTPSLIRHRSAETAVDTGQDTPVTTAITMEPKKRRSRRILLKLTLGFITIASGVGAAYYFEEPHVVYHVNRVLRKGRELLEEHGLKPKKAPPPRAEPMRERPKAKKRTRRKTYPRYRRYRNRRRR